MSRQIGLLIAIFCGSIVVGGQRASRSLLHGRREAATDLEISGMARGVPAGESRFVSRESLMELPQVATTIDELEELRGNAGAGLHVKGIYLSVLARSLGVEDSAVAVSAVCNDGYTSTFPAEYIRNHRPVFVLTIEGMTPHDWAVKNHRFDAGPYFIGYESFAPAFRVRAHIDQPQEPDDLSKIVFDTEERLFGAIFPKRVAGATDPEVMDGYRIARQNCYRCHNSGAYGGTKAGMSWSEIGAIAKERPDYFSAWVRNPQEFKTKSEMPANKEYDKATLTALQRYFATFAVKGQ